VVLKFSSFRRPIFACLLLLLFGFTYVFASPIETPAESSTASDQLEVAITKDGFHHVYLLYAQKESQCLGCAAKSRLRLAVGDDEDGSWQAARELTPPSFDQASPSITVDPSDQRTLYAAWLERSRKDVMLAKSSDFGRSWSLNVVGRADNAANKPVINARGQNVQIAFGRDHEIWAASSHDGGITFSVANVKAPVALQDVLSGGATLDSNGNAFVAWEGYSSDPAAHTNLYISKSSDQGKTWTSTLMDVSSSPTNCKASDCEWGYLGAQITIASDSAGTLYALWNADRPGNDRPGKDRPSKDNAERVYFASSTTAGETWSQKSDVSGAPVGTKHVLPAIMAGASGEVRIAWMDARNSPRWSAYERSSTNGGATWSDEELLSMYAPNSGYIPENDFDRMFSPAPEDARANGASQLSFGGM